MYVPSVAVNSTLWMKLELLEDRWRRYSMCKTKSLLWFRAPNVGIRNCINEQQALLVTYWTFLQTNYG